MERVQKGESFDPVFLEYLYTQYATDSEQTLRQSQTIDNTQDLMSNALSVISSIISETDSQNIHIQQTLDNIIDEQNNDINAVISALVTAATEMKKSSTNIRTALEESRKEVEGLKKDLADVSVEAQRDFLTGVCNRKALDHKMTVLMDYADEHQEPLSLLMIDIDYFKRPTAQ